MDFPKDYFDLILPAPEELLKKSDVINNLTEFALKMQKEFGKEISINQCRAAIYGAFDALPPAVPQPELYGYNFEYLVAFAIACRRTGVDEGDLKTFANNLDFAFQTVSDEIRRLQMEAVAKSMGGE